MPSRESTPGPNPTPDTDAARREREQRLSEALRANLKRRKTQARGRAEGEDDKPSSADPGHVEP